MKPCLVRLMKHCKGAEIIRKDLEKIPNLPTVISNMSVSESVVIKTVLSIKFWTTNSVAPMQDWRC